jgi:hypothetical protein
MRFLIRANSIERFLGADASKAIAIVKETFRLRKVFFATTGYAAIHLFGTYIWTSGINERWQSGKNKSGAAISERKTFSFT